MHEFVKVASEHGWTTPNSPEYTPGSVISMSRGAALIEIEIGSGGIPRKVRRFNPLTGKDEVISQNYIRLAEVMKWLQEEEPGER